mmetsp:Transcript_21540/g.53106  ORF Transcript_21540/g.53106 Transcript_21540/m.53106 type:complete len:221 (-) Transcript_21540:1778-2440(-)
MGPKKPASRVAPLHLVLRCSQIDSPEIFSTSSTKALASSATAESSSSTTSAIHGRVSGKTSKYRSRIASTIRRASVNEHFRAPALSSLDRAQAARFTAASRAFPAALSPASTLRRARVLRASPTHFNRGLSKLDFEQHCSTTVRQVATVLSKSSDPRMPSSQHERNFATQRRLNSPVFARIAASPDVFSFRFFFFRCESVSECDAASIESFRHCSTKGRK